MIRKFNDHFFQVSTCDVHACILSNSQANFTCVATKIKIYHPPKYHMVSAIDFTHFIVYAPKLNVIVIAIKMLMFLSKAQF